MQYRPLGNTGVKVSALCLGTAFRGQDDQQVCVEVINRAISLGCNFIDSAFYGEGRAEEVVGKAIKDKRHEVFLCTKIFGTRYPAPNSGGLTRLNLMRGVEDSLARLQTDHIDLYLLHAFDPNTPLAETLAALDDMVRQGKVRYIGCSNFRAWKIVEALWESDKRHRARFVCIQNQWGQPLWLACNRGHYEVAVLLLECGARANPAQYASGGAVHWPYQAGDRRLANLLFLHGAVADPLSYCLTGDMAALAEHLQAHPEEREGLPWSALLAGNEDVLDHCLTQGPAIPEERHFNLLSQAIRGWRIGDLKINNEGWDPRSLQRNLERLLAHGYDPNVRNHRSSRANFTILHHLAAKACNPGAYGHTATEIVDFARVLIDAGADPNALEDQLQSTPLGWAARIGNGELVDYLLSRGADPNRAGADWSRPLAWAKKKGHGEIATLLRTQGAEG